MLAGASVRTGYECDRVFTAELGGLEDVCLHCRISCTHIVNQIVWLFQFPDFIVLRAAIDELVECGICELRRAAYRTRSEKTKSQQLRLRWFFRHPASLRGKQELVQRLTQYPEYYAIEMRERWDVWRIGILISVLLLISLAVGVGYSVYTGDVSSGFAIAGVQ